MSLPPSPLPLIIPVFLPHAGCPHACAFCNQRLITGASLQKPALDELRSKVLRYTAASRKKIDQVELAFFGGNFLGLPDDGLLPLLAAAKTLAEEGAIHMLRFSTRPDTIHAENINRIRRFPVATVELGVQSMDDEVLVKSFRGHAAADTENAVQLLRKTSHKVGMQIMAGLPGDDETRFMRTVRRIVKLAPDFVRIYPTLVLPGSKLADWYRSGLYQPLPLDTCIRWVKQAYLLFQAQGIPVIRMGLQAGPGLDSPSAVLAGPYHPAFGHLVLSEIFLDQVTSLIAAQKMDGQEIEIRVHPRDGSRLRGLKNRNLKILQQRFQLTALHVVEDAALQRQNVVVSAL